MHDYHHSLHSQTQRGGIKKIRPIARKQVQTYYAPLAPLVFLYFLRNKIIWIIKSLLLNKKGIN